MTIAAPYRRTMASAKPITRQDDTSRWTSLDTARRKAEQQREDLDSAAWKEAFARAELAFPLKAPKRTRLDAIIRRICRVYRISPAELASAKRDQRLAIPRQAVCYWAYRLTNLSLPQIGKKLGRRDHTTVLHAVQKHVLRRAVQGRHLRPARSS